MRFAEDRAVVLANAIADIRAGQTRKPVSKFRRLLSECRYNGVAQLNKARRHSKLSQGESGKLGSPKVSPEKSLEKGIRVYSAFDL